MKNAKIPVFSVILYVFAGLTGVFAIWTIHYQVNYLLPNWDGLMVNVPFRDNAYIYIQQFLNGSQGLVMLALALLLAAAAELLRRQTAGGAVLAEETPEDQPEDKGSFFDDEDGEDTALETDGDPDPDEMFTDEENDD